MKKAANFLYRALRSLKRRISDWLAQYYTLLLMKINQVVFREGFVSQGIPAIYMHPNASFEIGAHFKINNTVRSNPIGRNCQCLFRVDENASLKIGNNVGLSGTVIVCQKEVMIADNVKIGGNTCLYDTDFHSLNAKDRVNFEIDQANKISRKIFIDENVFIGAHSTILKGVTIGKNSIVGACSTVTKDIPANEVWAGNPAKYIRKIDEN